MIDELFADTVVICHHEKLFTVIFSALHNQKFNINFKYLQTSSLEIGFIRKSEFLSEQCQDFHVMRVRKKVIGD